ncbi:hypothetical protein LTR84_004017 [Exophiala bonariae]|uniref:Alcohol dehydrogenase-like C-terminal domain-containing protein n=1 Tax=Exophiala bonariae TaxID=1690606 RepID=A0AAV9N5I1_9EURO|nr:hypothetical protein LTR84_004017 [Exophiala bonariae]
MKRSIRLCRGPYNVFSVDYLRLPKNIWPQEWAVGNISWYVQLNQDPGEYTDYTGGGGGVGIQGVQLAAAMGMRPVVVDTGDEREALSKQYGAEYFFDFQKVDPVKAVLDLTGDGGHGVFVTGVQAYPVALQYIGQLKLQPDVVGRSKFNEAIQKLRNGQVAGRMVVDFNID